MASSPFFPRRGVDHGIPYTSNLDILADTSVVLRFISPDDPKHPLVLRRIRELSDEGHRICFTPQVARECWSVMTRPVDQNGFGLTIEEALGPMSVIEDSLYFLDDFEGIFARWQDLVAHVGVSGKQVHDANHVAAMLEHGISEILTLDKRDFARNPGITVRDP